MRIIKGKDYYDYALAYGVDPEIVLVRDRIELDSKNEIFKLLGYRQESLEIVEENSSGRVIKRSTINNYCGYRLDKDITIKYLPVDVIVAGVHYYGHLICSFDWSQTHRDRYFWSNEQLETFFAEYGLKVYYNHGWWFKRERPAFDCFKVHDKFRKWMEENRYHILTYEYNDGWIANGDNLGKMQFHKAMEGYQIAQELSMWISNLPKNPLPNPIDITDNAVKIAKHGFDKNSFRKVKANV